MKDENTAMIKLADLLRQHEIVMDKCPEIIEIIEDLYVQIERQQIEQAFESGKHTLTTARKYYNQTYG